MQSSADWDVAWVRARWQAPDRTPRTGLIATALNARAGQHVRIWVTAAGKQTKPPITEADIRDQVMFAILLTVTGWAVALTIGVAAVRMLANRRRMACWQREWDVSGPLWSRQA
jgi:hypothetical protein